MTLHFIHIKSDIKYLIKKKYIYVQVTADSD